MDVRNETELEELCEFFQRLNDEQSRKCRAYNSNPGQVPLWQFYRQQSITASRDELDKFLEATGGIYGGWLELHHRHFVNLRSKHNLSSVLFIFRQHFPDITEQEILEHDKWYTRYLKLKCNQRRAARQYGKLAETKVEPKHDLRSVTSVKVTAKRDLGTKVELERWREWKSKMNDEKRKAQELEATLQRKRDQTKWLRHLERKKLIDEFQIKKQAEMMAAERAKTEKEFEERRIRSATANKMLAVFRRKDESWMQQKRTKKQLAQRAEQERLEYIRAVISKLHSKISVDRDPYRLLVPTVEWKQKMRKVDPIDTSEEAEDEKSKTLTIANVQRLAVPEWRRMMNRGMSE